MTASTLDDTDRRAFVLIHVQPGLAGLMDGSISTLGPIFAAAFATEDSWQTFLVDVAASLGAGISMGFTKSRVRRRGSHRARLAGHSRRSDRDHDADRGLGHTLSYPIPHFWPAT